MSRVLVTGGAGFIGSHLVHALIVRGYDVNVLDNFSTGHLKWINKKAHVLHGQILYASDLRSAMYDCTGVFHLAAQSRSAPSANTPEQTIKVNVEGTHNVLIAAKVRGVQKLVYAGSATYYGNNLAPQKEEMRGDFLNAYGLSKYMGEELCKLYEKQYGLQSNILRLFNVYGKNQPTTGEYALVLGKFLARAKQGLPLEIHGSGFQRRDFVHVSDVVEAMIAAYETVQSGQVWNVGSGTNVSIKELADMISPLQVHTPARVADAWETLADISRIKAFLGWEPKMSLEEGLQLC